MKKNLKELLEKNGLKVYGSLISVNGELFPLPLVKGNKKIGGGVWHASTLPGAGVTTFTYKEKEYIENGTCPVKCPGCYGMNGCYKYSNVKFYLTMRTRFLRKYPREYFTAARCQIIAENVKLLRVHATGDFIENEAAGWYNIFKDMPQLSGWTYTKCDITGDIAALDSLNNFNIVKSIIPGCGFNFGHIDYLLKVYDKLTAAGNEPYICKCGIDKNQHCTTCAGCSRNKYVLFIEHGTGYQAENDTQYNTIKEIIERQPAAVL